MSLDDTFFSENEESQSDMFSSDGYSVVFGPGEASDITMPFTDVPSMRLSGITLDGMVNTVVKNCSYPKISAEHVNVVNFALKKGHLFKIADTTINLIGAPTKERAMRILDELASIFPKSLNAKLRWWAPVADGEVTSLKPIGYNPFDNTFYEQPEVKDGYDGVEHTVFVLYYCDEAVQDTTEAFSRLVAGGQVPPPADSIILPLADYLLDPTAHLCSQIPASMRSPLVEVEINGRLYRVPFTVSLLETISADQLLRKGGRVVSLSYWNPLGVMAALYATSVIAFLTIVLLLAVSPLVFFLIFSSNPCARFFNPSTWILTNSDCGVNQSITAGSAVKTGCFSFGHTNNNISSVGHALEPDLLNTFIRKTSLVTDMAVSATNAVTVSVALAVRLSYEYLSAQFRSFWAYVKHLETRAKHSEKVRQYKQEHAKVVSKTLTCDSAGFTAHFGTPSPTDSCANFDVSLSDVLEAHVNPFLSSVQSSVRHSTGTGLDHLNQAYKAIAPKIEWLTHPKQAWRDDLIVKMQSAKGAVWANVDRSCQQIKHSIQQTGKSFSKTARSDWSHASKWVGDMRGGSSKGISRAHKWFLDKYGKRESFTRASEAGYKRAQAGLDWLKRKASRVNVRPFFKQ